jgi:LCP family protein required for cell wall assembly
VLALTILASAAPVAAQDPSPAPSAPTDGPTLPIWDEGRFVSVLLVGADSGRKGYPGHLTDTMIVARVDTQTGQVAFIGLPRDTQGLPIPRKWAAHDFFGGLYEQKANTIYTMAAWYRPDLFPGPKRNKGYRILKEMLAELYGFPIDYFVAVDLRGFRDVIDKLGGVMVDVQNPVYDDHYPSDDGRGAIKLYIRPGYQIMNGKEALAYARSRHATSDFDRSLRQQRVVTSVRDQLDLETLLEPGVLPALMKSFRKSIRTDVPNAKLPKIIALIQSLDLDKRVTLELTPPTYSQVCYPCPPLGLYSLKANIDRIRRDVQALFRQGRDDAQQRQALEAEGAIVHVLNGTRANNLRSTRIADYLASIGMNASVPPVNGGAADRDDHTDTVITVFNGRSGELPETIAALEKAFGITVVTADDPAQEADVVVVVGTETPALRP